MNEPVAKAPRKRNSASLNLLKVRQVQTATDGDHGDGGGLLLRVRGDSASWVFRFTAPTGRRREMGFGPAHRGNAERAGASLTTARDMATKAREQLRQGIDPIDTRDGAKVAARQVEVQQREAKRRERWTLARAARDYHARVVEPSRSAKHAAQWIASLENHVPPALWHTPIDAIEPPQLLGVLQAVTPHERARNVSSGSKLQETVMRLRQRLDAVFEDAIFHKRCKSNPAVAIRRKLREAQPKRERGSFRALPYREAPAFMARLRMAEGLAPRALELTVLCAARTSEMLEAEWSEFDLDAEIPTWVCPAERMKAGEAHTVFLSEPAIEVLRTLAGIDARLLFPSSTKEDQPLSNMAMMLAVLDRLGAREHTTVHGLARATFSTWANETGAARPDVIEACLAHEEGDRVRAAYNRAEFNQERRRLLEAWAAYLSREAGQVVPLKAA
jgi:integrase